MKFLVDITQCLYNNDEINEVQVWFEEGEYHKLIQKSSFKRLFLNDKTLLDANISAVSFIPNRPKIESFYKVVFRCKKFFNTEEEYENYQLSLIS